MAIDLVITTVVAVIFLGITNGILLSVGADIWSAIKREWRRLTHRRKQHRRR